LHHLAKHVESTVTWIDTTGDFSPENACQILDCIEVIRLLMVETHPYHYYFQKFPSILERLQISLAFDIDAAQAIVDHSIQNIDARATTCPFT
jgi:RAD51-like protein 3